MDFWYLAKYDYMLVSDVQYSKKWIIVQRWSFDNMINNNGNIINNMQDIGYDGV